MCRLAVNRGDFSVYGEDVYFVESVDSVFVKAAHFNMLLARKVFKIQKLYAHIIAFVRVSVYRKYGKSVAVVT